MNEQIEEVPVSAYEPFTKGDQVWSVAYGFDEVTRVDKEDNTVYLQRSDKWITADGRLLGIYKNRPRSFYHAVEDTDEEMMQAIANGDGVMRPRKRGRFDFRVGDTVLYAKDVIKLGQVTETKRGYSYSIAAYLDRVSNGEPHGRTVTESFTPKGQEYPHYESPQLIRLVDDEEIELARNMTCLQAILFIASKAIEVGWEKE